MQKVRYEIDPHNRLVRHLPRFRKVIDGKFKTDKKNTLIYHVKAPVPRDADIPHQIKLRGKWALTKDHNLQLTLDKWGRQTYGDRLTIEGNIMDVRKNALLFSVMTTSKDNIQSTYVLKLEGAWQADKNNRLTFRVQKEKGRHDILIFKSAWEINKNHRIIYQYEKARLIRKRKKIHTLTFKGHWDIRGKARLSYVIDRNTDSVFNFLPSVGIFKEGYIKYEVGVGLSHKTITLFGTWKIKRNIGLLFEVEYEKGKVRAIVFGAKAKLTGRNEISFRLRNDINKDIGVSLRLSHKFLKGDGEIFLRGLRARREAAIHAGAGWRW